MLPDVEKGSLLMERTYDTRIFLKLETFFAHILLDEKDDVTKALQQKKNCRLFALVITMVERGINESWEFDSYLYSTYSNLPNNRAGSKQ